MGLCLSRSSTDGVIFPLFLCSIRKPVSLSRPALRSRRRAQDRRTDLVACFALARLHLDGSEHDGPLGAVGRRSEGSPLSGRNQSRHNLVSGGSRTRTTMQSCASAAKLRSGGPILPIGIKAKGPVGNPPPRTVVGGLQRPPFIVPDAKRGRLVQRPAARSATGRSEACAPRPRSWACEHRERSRCELDTTALRRFASDM